MVEVIGLLYQEFVIKEFVIRVMHCISLRLPVGKYNVFLLVIITINLYCNLYCARKDGRFRNAKNGNLSRIRAQYLRQA